MKRLCLAAVLMLGLLVAVPSVFAAFKVPRSTACRGTLYAEERLRVHDLKCSAAQKDLSTSLRGFACRQATRTLPTTVVCVDRKHPASYLVYYSQPG